MAVKLDRQTVAKVSAYYTSWVDPEDFAKFAENNLIYKQKFHVGSKPEWAFYVLCGAEEEIPLNLLTDPSYASNLALVLPYDAVNLSTLSILWLIEIARQPHDNLVDVRNLFSIEVVGDVGRDSSTGEIRYGCLWFTSTLGLLRKIEEQARRNQKQLQKIREKHNWSNKTGNIPMSFNIYMKSLLKNMLRVMKNISVTLSQVDDFTPSAKKYKVSE